MDLPLLSVEKPAAASLQGHQPECHSARAASVQHDDRVQTIEACAERPNFSLRGGHVPGGGQPGCAERILGHELELASRERPRWTNYIRDHGKSAFETTEFLREN